ncbi:MAG: hypothetical protein EOM91_21800 [Sphingobacteriia bacterium]|nr:hypothetical protein [Sphingobacteriia bacterium]
MNRPRYPLARLSPAKHELLVLSISRESVIAGDILPVREELAPLAATREAAMKWEGTLTFYFEGRDDDPRETAEIRAYFQALTEAWPYWLHFIEKVGDTLSGTFTSPNSVPGASAWGSGRNPGAINGFGRTDNNQHASRGVHER